METIAQISDSHSFVPQARWVYPHAAIEPAQAQISEATVLNFPTSANDEEPLLLPLSRAAVFVGVSEELLLRLVESGDIPVVPLAVDTTTIATCCSRGAKASPSLEPVERV